MPRKKPSPGRQAIMDDGADAYEEYLDLVRDYRCGYVRLRSGAALWVNPTGREPSAAQKALLREEAEARFIEREAARLRADAHARARVAELRARRGA